MKLVPILNRRGEAVADAMVDDSDYEAVVRFPWRMLKGGRSGVRYAAFGTRKGGAKFAVTLMRRLITVAPEGIIVDHIDGNGLNNTRSNLRLCTRSQNQCNSVLRAGNPLGFKGVTRAGRRFVARIRLNNRLHNLGTFDTPELAHAAYVAAAKVLHGEFACSGVR